MDCPCRRQEQQQRDGGQDEAAPRALGRIAGGRQLGLRCRRRRRHVAIARHSNWPDPMVQLGGRRNLTLLSVQTSLAGEVPSRFMEAGTRPMQGFAAVLMAALAAATPAWATSSAADPPGVDGLTLGPLQPLLPAGDAESAWCSCCPTCPAERRSSTRPHAGSPSSGLIVAPVDLPRVPGTAGCAGPRTASTW